DRVTVLRRGEVVARFHRREAELSSEAMARAMVGRELAPPPARGLMAPGAARLEVEGLVARGPTGREGGSRWGGARGLPVQGRGGGAAKGSTARCGAARSWASQGWRATGRASWRRRWWARCRRCAGA